MPIPRAKRSGKANIVSLEWKLFCSKLIQGYVAMDLDFQQQAIEHRKKHSQELRHQGIEVDESKYYRQSLIQLAKQRERATSWRRSVIVSDAFAMAFENQALSIEHGTKLVDYLREIRFVGFKYGNKPAELADAWLEIRPELELVVKHLQSAHALLLDLAQRGQQLYHGSRLNDHAKWIARTKSFLAEPHAQSLNRFDSKNLRTRGRAAGNPKGAFATWMALEMARLIPASSPKRATTISRLLELVDVHVSETTVSTILRRSTKTKA